MTKTRNQTSKKLKHPSFHSQKDQQNSEKKSLKDVQNQNISQSYEFSFDDSYQNKNIKDGEWFQDLSLKNLWSNRAQPHLSQSEQFQDHTYYQQQSKYGILSKQKNNSYSNQQIKNQVFKKIMYGINDDPQQLSLKKVTEKIRSYIYLQICNGKYTIELKPMIQKLREQLQVSKSKKSKRNFDNMRNIVLLVLKSIKLIKRRTNKILTIQKQQSAKLMIILKQKAQLNKLNKDIRDIKNRINKKEQQKLALKSALRNLIGKDNVFTLK